MHISGSYPPAGGRGFQPGGGQAIPSLATLESPALWDFFYSQGSQGGKVTRFFSNKFDLLQFILIFIVNCLVLVIITDTHEIY